MKNPIRLLVSVSTLAFALATLAPTQADAAKARKHKKVAAATASMVDRRPANARYWGQDVVRAGPLYNGEDYLGDDPDPNIRFQLLRDLSGRYGGGDQ
jgi:hypothetical protein